MAKRTSTSDSADAAAPDAEAQLLRAGLDTLTFGFAIFDDAMKLVASNQAFRTLRGYPSALCKAGTELAEFYLYNAERGDYGPGNADALARTRMNRVRARKPHALEFALASGQTLQVQYSPMGDAGLVLTYSDITARKRAEEAVARKEAQLKVALDNMPGALCYTNDDLNIVICNDRFADMYPVPPELLEPGRPYTDLLRHLATRGYYGEGDVEALVGRRVESLRNPTGSTFEDRTPDGRTYEIYRRRAAPGGTVTVITEITGLKVAESNLARKEAQLHLALDNMPGALSYIDEALNIVFCNDRFADVYPVPRELLQPGRPYVGLLNYLAKNGYYGEGDVEALVDKRMESLRNPTGQAFEDRIPDGRVLRIGRRRIAGGGTVTVMTDITELKDAEKGLLDAKLAAEEATRLVTEKKQMLESLASKLSKYLSPQIYRQIFSGEKNVEVASQRKKMTISSPTSPASRRRRTSSNPRSSQHCSTNTCGKCRQLRSNTAPPSTSSSETQSCCSSAILKRAARGKMPSPASGWPSRCNNECVTCRPNGASAARNMFSSCASESIPAFAPWATSAATTASTIRSSATK